MVFQRHQNEPLTSLLPCLIFVPINFQWQISSSPNFLKDNGEKSFVIDAFFNHFTTISVLVGPNVKGTLA